jgi:hypothetical protein
MKKRLLVRLALVSCLALTGLVLFLRWTSPIARINRESFQQIRLGMTEEEVIAILGVPPSKNDLDYLSKRVKKKFDAIGMGEIRQDNSPLNVKAWVGDGYAIEIGFDQTGACRFVFHFAFEESLVDKMRRRLHLP